MRTGHDADEEQGRRASCEGKEVYRTYGLAARIAKRRGRIRLDGRLSELLVVYHCFSCGRFHLGEPIEPRLPRTKGRKKWRLR